MSPTPDPNLLTEPISENGFLNYINVTSTIESDSVLQQMKLTNVDTSITSLFPNPLPSSSSSSSPPTNRRRLHLLPPGSKLGSVVNCCNVIIGLGTLSIPHALSLSGGLLPGLLLLLLAALATNVSLTLLVHSCHVTNRKSYDTLARDLYGARLSHVVEWSIVALCLGANVAYIIAVGDILERGVLDVMDDDDDDGCFVTKEMLIVGFWAGVMVPLSLCESVGSVRYASLLGNLCISYTVVSTVMHSLMNAGDNPKVDIVAGGVSFWDVIRGISNIMFAFTCQINIPEIYHALEPRTERNMATVIRWAVGVCLVAYGLMGVFGYWEFGSGVSDNILENYCVSDDPEVMIILSFVCVTLCMMMGFPLNVLPCRVTLDIILSRWMKWYDDYNNNEGGGGDDVAIEAPGNTDLGNYEEEEDDNLRDHLLEGSLSSSQHMPETMSRRRRIYLTLFIDVFSLVVALLIPDLSVIFGFVGGAAGSLTNFIIPGLFHLKVGEKKGRLTAWLLIVGGGLIAILSTVATIIRLFEGDDTEDTCQG